jgi:DNA-binding MarR family transcriptional regulator
MKMTKKEAFIEYVEALITHSDIEMSDDAKIYWDSFKNKTEVEKPVFTDNGKLVLQCMKDKPDIVTWKARDIAEELFISSRTVSGAMRKLVSDGYVEKVSQEPVLYMLTEKGKITEII